MLNTVKSYLDNAMVKIPGGKIELRDDRKKLSGRLK